MKPYGREKKVRSWKKDFHIHIKNRKIANWWEEICNILPRSSMKQKIKKEIDEHL